MKFRRLQELVQLVVKLEKNNTLVNQEEGRLKGKQQVLTFGCFKITCLVKDMNNSI